jgi:putative transcriptional regulator
LSPRHHPAESLLLDYGGGALAAGARVVIASHLSTCPACSHTVAEVESVGGAILSALPAVELQTDALAWALARIERPAREISQPPIAIRPDWISTPFEAVHAAQKRRRWAAPGVWVAPISSGPGKARTYLLGVGASMSVPIHTHHGTEMICVLRGNYDDRGVPHGPGDFVCNDESVTHRPAIAASGDCVCLVFAEDALVPLDWVGRLFQPLAGI